jgi:hypothetical protein
VGFAHSCSALLEFRNTGAAWLLSGLRLWPVVGHLSCLEELQIKHLHIQLDRLPGLGLYMRQALFGTQAVCNQTLTQVSEIFCNII